MGHLQTYGTMTLTENVADNGGVKVAYNAYRDWLDREGPDNATLPGLEGFDAAQKFWIFFARLLCTDEEYSEDYLGDDHSFHKLRVEGALMNSREFARDFECPENSRMNPSDKCPIW